MGFYPVIATVLAALFGAAALFLWLSLRQAQSTLGDARLNATEQDEKLAKLSGELTQSQMEAARMEERARAAEQATTKIEAEVAELEEQIRGLTAEVQRLQVEKTQQEERLEAEKRNIEAQQELLKAAEEKFSNIFKSIGAQTLKDNSEAFLDTAKRVLTEQTVKAEGDLEKRNQAIKELVNPIQEALKKVDDEMRKLDRMHAERSEKSETMIGELMRGIKEQGRATNDLRTMLKGSSSRGRMGEIMFRRMLEQVGLKKGIHFDEQFSETDGDTTRRPDFVVRLPGDRSIVIDAKTPLNAYELSVEMADDDLRREKLKEHAKALRGHIDSLAKKEYDKLSIQPEMVVMYLPIEASLNAALEVDPDVVVYGYDRRILVVSPTLLYAMLQVVVLNWKQAELQKNAEEISKMGGEMTHRIGIVVEHLAKVGAGLSSAVGAYNDSVGSIERNLITTAKRLQKLGIKETDKALALPSDIQDAKDFTKPDVLIKVPLTRKKELDDLAAQYELDILGEEPEALPAEVTEPAS